VDGGGVFPYNADEKGRVVIHPSLRYSLGQNFILSKGLDGCVFVMTKEMFRTKITDQFKKQPADLFSLRQRKRQRFFADQVEATTDPQNRVAIPPSLRLYADISAPGEVMVVGLEDRVEIWSRSKWTEFMETISEEDLSPPNTETGLPVPAAAGNAVDQ
jgi:MraZ protein